MNAGRCPLDFLSNNILACLFPVEEAVPANFLKLAFGRNHSLDAIKVHLDSLVESGLLRRTFPKGEEDNLDAAQYEIAAPGRDYCREHGLDFFKC